MRLAAKIFEPMMAKGRRMRASQFAVLPRPAADVVFLGDSITEGACWDEWFPDLRVTNRGIGGDRTEGVLARTDTIGTASAVFLLIGTNDVTMGVRDHEIVGNVSQITAALKDSLPTADIVVQSIMPRTRKLANRIRDLNLAFREVSVAHDAHYLDLWPALATTDDRLNPAFTEDKLHLNGRGYQAWADVLRGTAWFTRAANRP